MAGQCNCNCTINELYGQSSANEFVNWSKTVIKVLKGANDIYRKEFIFMNFHLPRVLAPSSRCLKVEKLATRMIP